LSLQRPISPLIGVGGRGSQHAGDATLKEGISEALESGLVAGECTIAALQNGGPDDFTSFANRLQDAWGKEYRRSRYMHKLIGNPTMANAGITLLDNARLPRRGPTGTEPEIALARDHFLRVNW
jgi:flavin-dependent dehydrogenase